MEQRAAMKFRTKFKKTAAETFVCWKVRTVKKVHVEPRFKGPESENAKIERENNVHCMCSCSVIATPLTLRRLTSFIFQIKNCYEMDDIQGCFIYRTDCDKRTEDDTGPFHSF
jgi:hypothetical protein